MKINKNGFTLVELLAVIVILAIIALIAVPIVMNVVEDSRNGATKSSALGYLDAVEKQMARNMLDSDKTNDFNDGAYEISELETKGVKVKGDKPTEGWVVIQQGKINNYSFKIGKYFINPDSNNQPEAKTIGEIKEKPCVKVCNSRSNKNYTATYTLNSNTCMCQISACSYQGTNCTKSVSGAGPGETHYINVTDPCTLPSEQKCNNGICLIENDKSCMNISIPENSNGIGGGLPYQY